MQVTVSLERRDILCRLAMPPQRKSNSSKSVTLICMSQRRRSPKRCLKSVTVSLSSCSISIPNCSMGSAKSGCICSIKYVESLAFECTQLTVIDSNQHIDLPLIPAQVPQGIRD
ncbi:hypothetical protein GQX74_010228 [Glossina fuscipes]|nr:hypothetical protein GQX74_010228 [Glossina fuscipes]